MAVSAADSCRQARRGERYPHGLPVGTARCRQAPPPDRAREAKQQSAMRGSRVFADLEVALDRLAADDLRGADSSSTKCWPCTRRGVFHGETWTFYGYLFTFRATTTAPSMPTNGARLLRAMARRGRQDRWVPLANLYFARHQYDQALKTLLRPNLPGDSSNEPTTPWRSSRKLRALGVTDQTLQ